MAGRGGIALGVVGLLLALCGTALAASPQTQRVSVTPSGEEPSSESSGASVSADGRYVAFISKAGDIVPGGHAHAWQVYVYDRVTGQTRMASTNASGAPGNSYSVGPAISADGTHVAFVSSASNLGGSCGPGGGCQRIYVKDLRTGQVSEASVSSSGAENNAWSAYPAISADGSVVAFVSEATNLVPTQPAALRNVFVHDFATGETEQVNVSPTDEAGNGECHWPSISANGRYVAFESEGSNLVPGGNSTPNIYVRDRTLFRTSRASESPSGKPGNKASLHPSISGDGRFVVFDSRATNLVNGGTKGDEVFERNLRKGTTRLVSISAGGKQANGQSYWPSVSENGGAVAYGSTATDLVGSDRGPNRDVYVSATRGARRSTALVSVSMRGRHGDGDSYGAAISADGRFVAFDSRASNLVPEPGRDLDVYLRGPLR